MAKMKKKAQPDTRTVNETSAREFSMETVLIDDPRAVEQFSSINLRFIRLLMKLQLPETIHEREESKRDYND